MQIVIDLSDETYKHMIDNEYCRMDVIAIHNSIKNGIVLPKHGDLKGIREMIDVVIKRHFKAESEEE